MRIEVSDGGAGVPVLADRKPDPVEPGGRGPFLLDQLAGRWGAQPQRTEPGKTVRVEVGGTAAWTCGLVNRW